MRTRLQRRIESCKDDFTNGVEKIQIPLILPPGIDPPNFTYIVEHQVLSYRDERSKACKCVETCSAPDCSCLAAAEEYDVVVECCDGCSCSKTKCTNRQFAMAIPPEVEVRHNGAIGFGVYARECLVANCFIGLYVGQLKDRSSIIGHFEATNNFLFEVRDILTQSNVLIDSATRGNFTRFLNHSCKPNVKTLHNYYLGSRRLPYVAFVSSKAIETGEQLTIDYGSQYFSVNGIQCQCGHCNGKTKI